MEIVRPQAEIVFGEELKALLKTREILLKASTMSPFEYLHEFGSQIRSGLAELRGNPSLEPEISIIIPAKDEANNILACLDTISRQRFERLVPPPRIETIVVANACEDKTAELTQKAGARVIVDPIRGYGKARKTGLLEAQGEICLITDADCGSHPLWVDTMVSTFRQNPELDALYGPSWYFDGNFTTYLYNIVGLTAKAAKRHYQGRNCAYGSLVRTILENSPFNINVGEDGWTHKAVLQRGGKTGWIWKLEATILTSDRRVRSEGVIKALTRRAVHLLTDRDHLVQRQYEKEIR